MDWGLKNRLSRIIQPDGRVVMLAVDHGYFLGPTSGLEEPWGTIEPLLPYADSLMLTRGTLRRCVPPASNVPIVLRVSGGTSILSELSGEGMTVAIEDAIRLNASAVTMSIFVGTPGERTTLMNLAGLIDEGEKYGIPVLAVTAVGKEMTRDARYLGMACRVCAELGAQFVKTYYCEPGFEQVTNACPVPIVIAGGKKIPEPDALVSGPGSGAIKLSPLNISNTVAAPGRPVLISTDVSGHNIGYVLFFTGFYDQVANSIFVADMDYIESSTTQEIDGVYYPVWPEPEFTLEFDVKMDQSLVGEIFIVSKIIHGRNPQLLMQMHLGKEICYFPWAL